VAGIDSEAYSTIKQCIDIYFLLLILKYF